MHQFFIYLYRLILTIFICKINQLDRPSFIRPLYLVVTCHLSQLNKYSLRYLTFHFNTVLIIKKIEKHERGAGRKVRLGLKSWAGRRACWHFGYVQVLKEDGADSSPALGLRSGSYRGRGAIRAGIKITFRF